MSGSGSGVSVIVNIAGDEIRGVQIERLGDADGRGAAVGPRPGAASGALGPPGTGQTPLDDGTRAREKIEIDPDWKNRPGYDPSFLGVTIPLPKIPEKKEEITLRIPAEYLAPGADPLVFPYHHYSLAFNKKRRIAWYSAANVDGDRRAHKYEREDDEWFFDPRMDDEDAPVHQIGEELYAAKKTDRGHITRYLDIQWGDTLDETRNATNDSFHFSNCALQLEGFNRGKDQWQGIERFLLEKKARKEKRRLVVITGPVLKKNDPFYRSKAMEENGTSAVRVPLSFWKICAIVPNDGRKLAVTAFVLGQPDIVELPGFEEAFDVTAFQVTVEKLAKLVGLGFPKILVEHDHFAKEGPGALEAAAAGLERLEDIVV